jgi:hypothetical protein
MLEHNLIPQDVRSITNVWGYLKEGPSAATCPDGGAMYGSFALESGPAARHREPP